MNSPHSRQAHESRLTTIRHSPGVLTVEVYPVATDVVVHVETRSGPVEGHGATLDDAAWDALTRLPVVKGRAA